LWRDYLRFAELFGMPREAAPASYPAFREYWDAQLAGDELFLTEEARYLGNATAFEIPLPAIHQAGKRIHDLLMLGSLPPRVRELYGVPFSPAQAAAFRAAVTWVRASRRATPGWLARGWNTRSFNMVAQTDRARIERGDPTPQVTDDGMVPLPRRWGQRTSSTTLPVAPRSSSSASASPARSSG
jgi:uncharacterized protein (DUF2236 family)